jgi:hypothetical protein
MPTVPLSETSSIQASSAQLWNSRFRTGQDLKLDVQGNRKASVHLMITIASILGSICLLGSRPSGQGTLDLQHHHLLSLILTTLSR